VAAPATNLRREMRVTECPHRQMPPDVQGGPAPYSEVWQCSQSADGWNWKPSAR
jgi:hypothetical protein